MLNLIIDLSAQIHLTTDGEPAAMPDPVLVDGEEFLATAIDQAVDFHSPSFPISDEDDGQPLQVQLHEQRKKPPDYKSLRPFFLQATADIVKRTFNAMMQYARSVSTSTHEESILVSISCTQCSPTPGTSCY